MLIYTENMAESLSSSFNQQTTEVCVTHKQKMYFSRPSHMCLTKLISFYLNQ